MTPFPFSASEWAAVRAAALPVVNAGLAGDAVVRASHLNGLLDLLAALRVRHGEHPALLETEADFRDDDAERVALYRRAAALAAASDIPTLSIRLSLADVLLDHGEPTAARAELRACEGELAGGDDSDQATWARLMEATSGDGS